MSSHPAVRRMSECFIKPPLPLNGSNPICHLSPWDILMLSAHYIQKGLLFLKPSPLNSPFSIDSLLHRLKHSLSLTLLHFYPLTGRLVTTRLPSYSIFVDCDNSDGARFIYAALDMTVSDILSPTDVPSVVQSFFDHDRAVNHDGHALPLLSVQVTELTDGVFIGCSMNHCLADGTSYWRFFNMWSEIFRAQDDNYDSDDVCIPISHLPIHNRWFPEGCVPPIILPFKHHDEFISRFEAPRLRERIFHFTAESIAKVKAKANQDSNTTDISSFQSLSALVWRCITRARSPPRDQKTICRLAANNRSRMEPPLPEEYFGNSIHAVAAETTSGELLEHDLGWAAWKIHVAVANHDDKAVRELVKKWLEGPMVFQPARFFDPYSVIMGSSPRFDMYGNEFGMGKAVCVRSGYANKFDGKVTSYPGREGEGSIDLEMCLTPALMTALESDDEFMNSVSLQTVSAF
ncbi:uncharacterized acetyltransferase At3g50280-like [Neltuma alba]|uniref:uncharacterized acetyltransferase At3g50280-like n=1 Tax=Neltuma alba TaxID=207710 RepID=UPI0010A50B1B|nr:uncharacterized acetyltransferase At3g50280-like [Prosopis alba]XP_028806892.1 uncharacterized acetyltransferase At3g50280-like [Prosopis alba]